MFQLLVKITLLKMSVEVTKIQKKIKKLKFAKKPKSAEKAKICQKLKKIIKKRSAETDFGRFEKTRTGWHPKTVPTF
jgi:hypothetical protein